MWRQGTPDEKKRKKRKRWKRRYAGLFPFLGASGIFPCVVAYTGVSPLVSVGGQRTAVITTAGARQPYQERHRKRNHQSHMKRTGGPSCSTVQAHVRGTLRPINYADRPAFCASTLEAAALLAAVAARVERIPEPPSQERLLTVYLRTLAEPLPYNETRPFIVDWLDAPDDTKGNGLAEKTNDGNGDGEDEDEDGNKGPPPLRKPRLSKAREK